MRQPDFDWLTIVEDLGSNRPDTKGTEPPVLSDHIPLMVVITSFIILMSATDVLIIGAGPCGLALAARLSERTPSALFTDDEHARYWNHHQRKDSLQREARRRRKQSSCSSHDTDSGYSTEASTCSSPTASSVPKGLSLKVLDAHGSKFLSAWHARFAALRIEYLRSPLFFHPDPRDRDGLLAYAYEQNRQSELLEIPGVVGREVSKHARKKARSRSTRSGGPEQKRVTERHLQTDNRDRIDYFAPSTGLFRDYCSSLVARYDLVGLVERAAVRNITYGNENLGCVTENGTKLFAVETMEGIFHRARIVVLATGASAPPQLPHDHKLQLTDESRPHATHVFAPGSLSMPNLNYSCTSPNNHKPIEIAIIGGGLTSAQLAVSLLSGSDTKISKVHLILRSPKYKLKPFDVDTCWVSKTRNTRMAEFWSADTDEERAEMLRAAKEGGSVSPAFDKEVQRWVRAGKLEILPGTRIADGIWDESTQRWELRLLCRTRQNVASQRPSDVTKCSGPTEEQHTQLPNIAHVFYATGSQTDFAAIPFLQDLQREHPLRTINGLPVINQDMMWNDDVPLLFTGALAALRLGPGAANLAGARFGAERVAWAVEQILGGDAKRGSPDEMLLQREESVNWEDLGGLDKHAGVESIGGHSALGYGYTAGATNRFDVLRLAE